MDVACIQYGSVQNIESVAGNIWLELPRKRAKAPKAVLVSFIRRTQIPRLSDQYSNNGKFSLLECNLETLRASSEGTPASAVFAFLPPNDLRWHPLDSPRSDGTDWKATPVRLSAEMVSRFYSGLKTGLEAATVLH